jgi:hypothetical protein
LRHFLFKWRIRKFFDTLAQTLLPAYFMTDLMNLFFFLLCFGAGVSFVVFCDRLK